MPTPDRRFVPFKTRIPRRVRRDARRALLFESAEPRFLMAADGFELLPDSFVETSVPVEVGSIAEQAQTQAADSIDPVLMVISNQDFWYQDYADTRAALEAAGLEVIVAAATTEQAVPHTKSGQGADGGFVTPDLALSDVEAEDYSGIVFSGGWGMAQYQYGFEGTYHNAAYNGSDALKRVVNDLIHSFVGAGQACCGGLLRRVGVGLRAARWTKPARQSYGHRLERSGARC